jgi:hypothetical protein
MERRHHAELAGEPDVGLGGPRHEVGAADRQRHGHAGVVRGKPVATHPPGVGGMRFNGPEQRHRSAVGEYRADAGVPQRIDRSVGMRRGVRSIETTVAPLMRMRAGIGLCSVR